MSNETTISERLRSLRQRHGFTQEELALKMGFTRSYISQLESGVKDVGPKFLKQLLLCEQMSNPEKWLQQPEVPEKPFPQPPSAYQGTIPVRWIPLISWAQAGMASDFSELPSDWQELIPTTVTDPEAFAIQLRGDSMEPEYKEGDIAVVLPNIPPRHGDLVIAKIKEHGMAFKMFNLVGGSPDRIRLKSFNALYDPMEYDKEQFHWIYTVDSVTKRVRR